MMNDVSTQISTWSDHLSAMDPPDVLAWAVQEFGPKLGFASSLGAEDQAIIHMLASAAAETKMFTLDTGRLFPETYELIEKTEARYGIRIEIFYPDTVEVESMVREEGINLFYKSVELRQRCCGVRKVHPLQRALSGLDAWVCGLRRDQALTRQDLQVDEWDAQNGLIKISPLWNWEEQRIWAYIKANTIPYNRLHDQGFLSIGCSSCTRAVASGEDVRAGRWWWEDPEHKECGLHDRSALRSAHG